jgi:hypothetical protein
MRRSRLALPALALVLPLAAVALVTSCGARSELYVDALEPEEDAGPDAKPDVIPDAQPDVPPDVPDAGLPPCDTDTVYIYLVTSETDL